MADWNEKVKKWRYGIEPDKVTTDEIREYIYAKRYQYQAKKTGDLNLWDLFQDDFKNFTVETFNRPDRATIQDLRHCLRCGGVYVQQNNKRLTIAESLIAVVEQDEFHEWTDDDVKEANADLSKGPITSIYITVERNLRPEMLAKVGAPRPTTTTPQPTRPPTPQSITAPQITLQPVSQNSDPQNPEPTTATIPTTVPVEPAAFTPTANTSTIPPLLQPTATNFVPANTTNLMPNAANTMPIYQTQQYQPQYQPQLTKLLQVLAKQLQPLTLDRYEHTTIGRGGVG
jgi:hypothetical protein